MKNEERILTLHPQGKKGVNIVLSKYLQVKQAILESIEEKGVITFEDLGDTCIEKLTGKFDGKILWYVVSVKQDLEARGIIERIDKRSPQRLRLVSTKKS